MQGFAPNSRPKPRGKHLSERQGRKWRVPEPQPTKERPGISTSSKASEAAANNRSFAVSRPAVGCVSSALGCGEPSQMLCTTRYFRPCPHRCTQTYIGGQCPNPTVAHEFARSWTQFRSQIPEYLPARCPADYC